MNIILLGYMCCGKSTIGREISLKLNMKFIDLDEYIENKEGKTIQDIFNEEGEIYFRIKENLYLKEILKSEQNYILSLGGGTPCYANNMDILLENKNSISIYLKASVDTLEKRLKNGRGDRPLLKDLNKEDIKEYISKHLFERNFYYQKATKCIIVDDKNIEKVVNEIKKELFR